MICAHERNIPSQTSLGPLSNLKFVGREARSKHTHTGPIHFDHNGSNIIHSSTTNKSSRDPIELSNPLDSSTRSSPLRPIIQHHRTGLPARPETPLTPRAAPPAPLREYISPALSDGWIGWMKSDLRVPNPNRCTHEHTQRRATSMVCRFPRVT